MFLKTLSVYCGMLKGQVISEDKETKKEKTSFGVQQQLNFILEICDQLH